MVVIYFIVGRSGPSSPFQRHGEDKDIIIQVMKVCGHIVQVPPGISLFSYLVMFGIRRVASGRHLYPEDPSPSAHKQLEWPWWKTRHPWSCRRIFRRVKHCTVNILDKFCWNVPSGRSSVVESTDQSDYTCGQIVSKYFIRQICLFKPIRCGIWIYVLNTIHHHKNWKIDIVVNLRFLSLKRIFFQLLVVGGDHHHIIKHTHEFF